MTRLYLLAVLIAPASVFGEEPRPRDITGLEFVPPATPASVSIGVSLGILAAALGVAYMVYKYIIVAPGASATADVRALRSLARLQAFQLIAKNKPEAHFSLLSRILRRYVDRQYQMTSRRQTTAEFLAAARQSPPLEPHVDFLASFLEACDVARFAPADSLKKTSRQLENELHAWLSAREPVVDADS